MPDCPSSSGLKRLLLSKPGDSASASLIGNTANGTPVGGARTTNFSVASAQNLFSNGETAYDDLGGENSGSFDFGLPFFFGRTVYTAIEGQSTPAGTGPFFAF